MTVEEQAGLHEETVKRAEEHAAANARPRRGRGPDRSERKVRTLTVDPRVMTVARRLLRARPGTRLQIVSAEEVIIR